MCETLVITDPDKFIDTSTNDYCVFKIHGCAVKSNERNDFVITKSDYMDFEIRHPLRKLEAQNKLIHNVFLFMGYSLNDSNFQSMYREIRRFSNSNSPSCFAVLNDVSPAKIAFWKGLGINIIQADALDIIRGIKNHSNLKLHSSWFEWRSKEGAREEDKQAIAQKTLDFIINEIKIEPESSPKCLNLILDSGTSILTFAKRIKNLLDNIDASNGIFEDISCINIVTNCAAIIDTLRWVHLVEKKSSYPIINLYIIGGKLRTETQAITITKNTDNEDLAETNVKTILSLIDDNSPRIGILGATTVSLEGFKTNSIDEVSTKRALIECSDTIIFMVDHSKFRIGGSNVFLSLQEAKILSEIKKKIYIFTDRPLDEITSSAFMTNNIKIELIS
jgi:DeoR/GlpR family transcriptional regulator of sugar metabolism